MTNGNDFAMISEFQTGSEGMKHYPLTKREVYAMAAMQGIMSNPEYSSGDYTNQAKALTSVLMADALIKELNN